MQCIQALVLVILLPHLETTRVTTFTMGNSSGWGFSVGNWTNGKTFKAGDLLVFNCDPSFHNMMVVDANGFNSCTASATFRAYSTGKDQVKLSKGHHYYICSIPGHCDGGLNIPVNVS
ncbi:hypothetical protein RJ639_046385 [Escallonia herrerae]|uniref:Basic blue protein n=1 Tax=Escallonia herrerae TaxID=1293975 RepID=A0AA89B4I6_9ASTE|nr:hypothetical protein RJ639_046385 [Escallonia herrerae]